jgi:hypothetical protein
MDHYYQFSNRIKMWGVLAMVAFVPISNAEDMSIDAALRTLLEDVEIQRYLIQRQAEQLESGSYQVQVGDTLDQIIKITMTESDIKNEFLRRAFVQANPSAFRSGNPNWLIAGRRIRIPTADDVLAVIFISPPVSVPQSTKNWIQFP